MLNERTQFVKIGYTLDLIKRRTILSQLSGVDLKLIGSIENAEKSVETRLHRAFKVYRGIGEWFNYSGLLKSYINSLSVFSKKNLDTDLAYCFLIQLIYGDNHFSVEENFGSIKAASRKFLEQAISHYEFIESRWSNIGYGLRTKQEAFLENRSLRMRYYIFTLNYEIINFHCL